MSNTDKKKFKTLKTEKTTFNKTKKVLPKKMSQEIVCKDKQFRSFNTFEDKIEQTFKKNKIDFTSANYNLEKQIISDLKKQLVRLTSLLILIFIRI